MLLKVTHETLYDYTPMVQTAHHVVHLQPLSSPLQQLREHALLIEPPPARIDQTQDTFGNHCAFFALPAPHDRLHVRAESLVDTAPRADAPAGGPSWETARTHFEYRAGSRPDPAAEFTFASPYVPRDDQFIAYARPSFSPGRPLLEAARDLMHRIHRDFDYAPDATDSTTPALAAFQARQGVCQDFAHVMVACLRAMGQPARYVSGYLLTHPPEGQPRLVGADASHAWVSVYAPALAPGDPPAGWHDFDPTNNRQPGEDYVLLAIGRDYGDVSPMRGVLHGGAHHTLDVKVTVEPLAELLAEPASR